MTFSRSFLKSQISSRKSQTNDALSPPPSPRWGCVVIVVEGRFQRNRQSGSSALRMRSFKGMGNRPSLKWSSIHGLEPRNGAMKGFRSKASSPDRLFRVGAGRFLVNYDAVSLGRGEG
jgi:hypothetical protein